MDDQPEEPKTDNSKSDSKKSKSAYAQLPFDLQPEELTQSGTQKMLLGEVDRLNAETGEIKDLRMRFHEADKKCAVLMSQFRQYTALEILYAMGIASAFAVFGWIIPLSPWSTKHWVALGGGLLMAGVAVWAKWQGVRHES